MTRESLDDDDDILPGGQHRCRAMRTDKSGRCAKPLVRGTTVCTHHGAGAPQVRAAAKRRLLELVDPALGTMARLMAGQTVDGQQVPPSVMKAAASDLLDRAGLPRMTALEVEAAAEVVSDAATLGDRILALRDDVMARRAADEAEQAAEAERMDNRALSAPDRLHDPATAAEAVAAVEEVAE